MTKLHSTILFLIITIFISCDQGPYKKAMDLNKIGTAYFLKNQDSALFYFEEAMKADSTFQPAIQNKANLLISQHKYSEALETINLLLSKKEYPEAWEMKGILLDKLGRTDEALKAYRRSIELRKIRLEKASSEQQKSMENYALGLTYLLMQDTIKGKALLINNLEESKNIKSLHDRLLKYAHDKNELIDHILNPNN